MTSHILADKIFCIHEDRVECFTGLKLAVLSVRRHAPDADIVASIPEPTPEIADWVSRQDRVRLSTPRDALGQGFNVKPKLLLRLIDEGYRNVFWFDSDIIWDQPLRFSFGGLDAATLVVTQESLLAQHQGGVSRTVDWGLKVGRNLGYTVNSGLIRVTKEHVPLLLAWQRLLNHPVYRDAQIRPWFDRPMHLMGDQEVLTALLCAEEFAGLPVVALERGRDIAQCFGPGGFSPGQRVASLARGPAFVHAMAGPKPWNRRTLLNEAAGRSLSERAKVHYQHLGLELSPYVAAARRYAGALDEDTSWLAITSRAGKMLALLSGHNANLQALPLALLDVSARRLRRLFGVGNVLRRDVLTASPLADDRA